MNPIMNRYAKTAIASFDVDAQKCFTPLCPAELPVSGGDLIVDALNAQAALAGYRIGSKDAHSHSAIWIANHEQPQFTPIEGKNVDVRWNAHAIVGTEGFDLLDGLPNVDAYDYFVWKGMEPSMHPYGACYHDLHETLSTGVIEFLRVKKVQLVLVGGLALDYCVKLTALELRKAGFEVVVNVSATRGISDATVEQAIADMRTAGIHVEAL